MSSSVTSIVEWKTILAKYEHSHAWRASWQLLNSIGSYIILWYLMFVSLSVSLWLTVLLAFPAAGVLVRIFIIFHDCVHGSFFKSRQANRFWGCITGLLTFTSYGHWRWLHLRHHASSGNLERRGLGDIRTMTVEEYLRAPRTKKFCYRLLRHPVILFIIVPILLFLVLQRFPLPSAKAADKRAVWMMDLALIALAALLISVLGWLPWAIIQFTILAIASSAGVWLFYVQHQFEEAYWETGENWDYVKAAMSGSSFYKLPGILQWFSGNIGFHHIHHLSPQIPNYNLERCHHSNPKLSRVKTLTLLSSLRSASLRLWDENSKQLISFQELKQQQHCRLPA